MCGFVGVVGNKNISLEESLNSISHRGPDQLTIKRINKALIGFNRLAIIDLNDNAMQPFENEDCAVYLNGEIYNYLELKKEFNFKGLTNSDVEIIPFLFSKIGIDFLRHLNGMFAMVIIDKKNKSQYLIKDRFGQKPLYYLKNNLGFFFSSEVKAIKSLIPLEVDPSNLHINLSCHLLPPPLSLYKNLKSIMPGSFIKIDRDFVITEKKWYFPNLSKNEKFNQEKFIDIFSDSINLRTRSDVPISTLLSGGLDSMLITEFVRKKTKNIEPLVAIIEDKEKWEGSNTDVINQEVYCNKSNLKKHTVNVNYEYWNKNIISIVNNYDELFVDSGNLIFYALCNLAKQNNIKVVLTGVGGDELFGGYPWQKNLEILPDIWNKKSKYFNSLESFSSKFLMNFKRTYIRDGLIRLSQLIARPEFYFYTSLSSIFMPDLLAINDSKKTLRELSKKTLIDSLIFNKDWGNTINMMNYNTIIPTQNFKSDMGAMFSSVENRSPFQDFRIFEYMFSINHATKIKNGPKSLLRELSKNYLPELIRKSQKSGPTMPLNLWFAGEKLEEIKNFAIKNKTICGDIMGGLFADSWCKKESYGFNINNKIGLFALTNLIIWLKINVENVDFDINSNFKEFSKI